MLQLCNKYKKLANTIKVIKKVNLINIVFFFKFKFDYYKIKIKLNQKLLYNCQMMKKIFFFVNG